MTQTLERLERRADTLGGIRGIVRTMKTLSAVNAGPYERAARAIDACHDTVLLGLQAFLYATGPLTSTPNPDARRVIVALGSDHGLCGNYNELVATEVGRRAALGGEACIVCVGAQLEEALRGLDLEPEPALLPPATVDGLGRVAGTLVARLDAIGRANAANGTDVTLVFTRRSGHGRQGPVAQRLLPLDPALVGELARARWPSRSRPQYRAPAAELLAALVRQFLFTTLFRAAAEALVTENTARLARMQQAERSVDERLAELATERRSVRQDEITTELLDVIVGFEALTKRRRRRTP